MELITTDCVYVCSAIFTQCVWENLKTDNKGTMKYENRPEALRLRT